MIPELILATSVAFTGQVTSAEHELHVDHVEHVQHVDHLAHESHVAHEAHFLHTEHLEAVEEWIAKQSAAQAEEEQREAEVTVQSESPAPEVEQNETPSTPPAPVTEPEPAPEEPTSLGGSSAKNEIMMRESGGDPNAVNPSTGAYGLFQIMPGVHADAPGPGSSAEAQSAWADQYVAERYGSWEAALAFHNANGWY